MQSAQSKNLLASKNYTGDNRNMTYEVWGTLNGTIETLEQDIPFKQEATWLAREYQMAFGRDWTIQVMEVCGNTAEQVEW
jgi:hypothetical protein